MTPEEIDILSQLTIIIPTYNRPLELERSIEYWRDTPVTVHILDGSDKPWFPVGSLKSVPKITYHHMPAVKNQTSTENLFQRILFGSKLPTTNFSAVVCDDDFYTISCLITSLRILKSQPTVDAVAGRVASYEWKHNQLKWSMYYNFSAQAAALSPFLQTRAERSRDWFLYSICKTDVWAKFLRASYEERSFSKLNFGGHEWMVFLFSLAMFRTFFIESIFLVRQKTIYGRNVGPTIEWNAWLAENDESEPVKELVEHLAESFRQFSSEHESFNHREYARYFIQREIRSFRESKSTQEKPFLTRLKSALLDELKRLNRKLTIKFAPLEKRVRRVPNRTEPFIENLTTLGYLKESSDITAICEILSKPREELRLRADI